jgi:hypothetical protein
MSSRFEYLIQNDTSTTGSAEIIVEDYKLFTGVFNFSPTGGSPSVSYAIKIKGDSSVPAIAAYALFSGTLTSQTQILVNNNDGNGAPITAYSILIEWSGQTDGAINFGMRKSY